MLLEIDATYDGDGSSSTTDDRSEVTYSTELTGKAAGEILRNGYYRIAASITGLVGQECQSIWAHDIHSGSRPFADGNPFFIHAP